MAKAKKCVGCGAESNFHPIVAVMNKDNAEEAGYAEFEQVNARNFVGVPCCLACHVDPTHRKRTVKAHFFPRQDEKKAVREAGSSNIGGR